MKTKSNRIRYLEQSFTKHEYFTSDYFSIIFWAIGLLTFGLLYGRTVVDDPSLTFFDALFIVMLLVGMGGGIPFMLFEHYETTGRIGMYFADVKAVNERMILTMMVSMALVLGIDFGIQVIESLTTIEQLLFFALAAVAEEYFYRYFISTAMYMVFFKLFKSADTKKVLVAEAFIVITCSVISTLVTSAFFYYSHFTAYAGREIILWGVFGASCVFTMSYLYTKSLWIPMIIHLVVNFLYGAIVFFGSFTVIG